MDHVLHGMTFSWGLELNRVNIPAVPCVDRHRKKKAAFSHQVRFDCQNVFAKPDEENPKSISEVEFQSQRLDVLTPFFRLGTR